MNLVQVRYNSPAGSVVTYLQGLDRTAAHLSLPLRPHRRVVGILLSTVKIKLESLISYTVACTPANLRSERRIPYDGGLGSTR